MERCREIFSRITTNGKVAIQEFIEDRVSEQLFLDFKRSSCNGAEKRLSNIDRKNLGKAISGFGNSEGGVIVWGVDCSLDEDGADVAKAEVLIENPQRFISLIEGAISGCTVPPHSGVENYVIDVGNNKGFVVTLVPKSNTAPHQMIPKKQYYIRAGSDFVPTPHDVLSGMFGRRPQPHVFHHYILAVPELEGNTLKITFSIAICNEGPGIAQDLFSICMLHSVPGENCSAHFDIPDTDNWTGGWEFGRQISLITNSGYRLPPGANSQSITVTLRLAPPFESALKISGSVGSGVSRSYHYTIENNSDIIEALYSEFIQKSSETEVSESDNQDLVSKILGKLESTEDA